MTTAPPTGPVPSTCLLVAPDGPWAGLGPALQRHGFQVCVCADAACDSGCAPSLVLLDPDAPQLSGRDLDLVVPRLARSGTALVVALVKRGDSAAMQRVFAAGALDCIEWDAAPEALECAALRASFIVRAHDRGLARRVLGADELDLLTGLPTRARFARTLAEALARARSARGNLAVLCFDLDRFRQVVGSLERADADELVLSVSLRLRNAIRERDRVRRPGDGTDELHLARVAGGTFTLLLEGLSRVEDASKVAARLSKLIEEPFSIAGQDIYLSTTVGIASFPNDGAGVEELLKCAETAAYCAKQQGAQRLQFYTPSMNARALERLTLESGLRHAIERDELVLHYQPRVEVATGRTVGLEALVRWRPPRFGLIAPSEFIPLAEETGLIVPLGEWVLRRACEQNRRWQARGFAPVKIAVNVSPMQFRQPDLFAGVQRTLERSGLDPRWLELEVTETGLMSNFESVAATLRRLKDLGVGLSIDDFGTGYSSLSYLRRFPIDALKIDQSFLREVTSNQEDASIVSAILLVGQSLKLTLVAEGVETLGQLAFLRIMKCDQAQGYLFSPPVAAEAVERFLALRAHVAAA